MIEIIKKHSPKEIYFGSIILYFLLFLNSAELLTSRVRVSDIFEIRRSIVYGLIRGIGDDHLYQQSATILYWVILVLFFGLIIIKAKSISKWLWEI